MFSIINVYRKDKTKIAGAILNVTTIIYMVVTMLIVSNYSEVVLRNPRFLVYFIGFSFAKLVVKYF